MKKQIIAVEFFFCVLFPGLLFAQGSDVEIQLINDEKYKGELLFVNYQKVIISQKFDDNDNVINNGNTNYRVYAIDSIKAITVFGKSKILINMGIYTLIGVGTGALIGIASGDDTHGFIRFSALEKALGFGIILGTLGLITGLVSGIISSTSDKTYEPMSKDFSSLFEFARYKVEAEFLLKEGIDSI